MTDIIIAVVLVGIIGSAITYIIRAKKKGTKCIGCPHSSSCGKKADCTCNSAK